MPKNVPAHIQLTFDFIRYEEARNKLIQIDKMMNNLGKGVGRGFRSGRAAISGILGFMTQGVKKFAGDMARTLRSAFMRTVAFGVINAFRRSLGELRKEIKETTEVSMNLARSAAIMSDSLENSTSVYNQLSNIMFDVRKNTLLFSSDIPTL